MSGEQINLIPLPTERAPWPSGLRSPTNEDLNWLEAECSRARDQWDRDTAIRDASWRMWRDTMEARDLAFERVRADGDAVVAVPASEGRP